MIRMSGLEGDIAEVAKQNGGDAVILVSSEAETVGTIGNSFGRAQGDANTNGGSTTMSATGSSTSVATNVQKQQSKYAVVKYVEREIEARVPARDDRKPVDSAPPIAPVPAN